MRHVIFGGDGFVGRHLAARLVADGEEVIVADIVKSDLPHYRKARFVHCDVTDPRFRGRRADSQPDDMVYNLSAKMLSPIQVRAKRHDFFFPVNYPRHREHHPGDGQGRRDAARPFHHRHDLRPHGHHADDRGASGRAARRIRPVEARRPRNWPPNGASAA